MWFTIPPEAIKEAIKVHCQAVHPMGQNPDHRPDSQRCPNLECGGKVLRDAAFRSQ